MLWGKGEVLGTSISAEEEESGGRGGGEVSGATNNQRKDLLYKDEDKNIVLPEDDVNDHTKWGGDRKYSVDNLYHLKKKENVEYHVKNLKSGAGNYITKEKSMFCIYYYYYYYYLQLLLLLLLLLFAIIIIIIIIMKKILFFQTSLTPTPHPPTFPPPLTVACCRFCNLFVPQRSTKKVQIAHLILAHPAAFVFIYLLGF